MLKIVRDPVLKVSRALSYDIVPVRDKVLYGGPIVSFEPVEAPCRLVEFDCVMINRAATV